MRVPTYFICVFIFISAAGVAQINTPSVLSNAKVPKFLKTSDTKATPETKKLLNSLNRLRENYSIFGHMDDLPYGNGWRVGKYNPKGYKSDVFNTCGDYPGVFGWDLGQIERTQKDPRINYIINGVIISDLKNGSNKCINREVSITLCGMQTIRLPGAIHGISVIKQPCVRYWKRVPPHKKIYRHAGSDGQFFMSLRDDNGNLIPVIFRPFHESNMTGCFWWNVFNNTTCEHDTFRQLWRFTADYLKYTKGVHNLLYAFSLNDNCQGYHFEMDYSIADDYPGNDYVDIIGDDFYFRADDVKRPQQAFIDHIRYHSKFIMEFCLENDKVPAVTENGYENFTQTTPWTTIFEKAFTGNQYAFVMLWRNPDRINDFTSYYSVYPEHPSAPDFKNCTMKVADLFFSAN